MKKRLLSIVLFGMLLSSLQIYAQSSSIEGVKTVALQNISAITENDEVKGYIAFYNVDKKSSKENYYNLNIWDANLNLKYNISVTRPRATSFIEGSFNGDGFCCTFYNAREGLEYVIYNQEGKQTGSYKIPEITKTEKALLAAGGNYQNLVALPSAGFARYGYDLEKGNTAIVTAFDNKGKVIWKSTYAGKDKGNYAFSYPIANNEKLLVSSVMVRESKYSQKVSESFLKFHDSKSGKVLFTLNGKGKKYQYTVSGVTVEDDHILAYGEYFGLEDNTIKEESTGLFVLQLDYSGNILKENYTTWQDIQKAMPEAMKNDKGKNVRVTMHKMVKTADNKFFIICEQFYKTADGMGIAANALGGGYNNAMAKIVLQNLVVLELDANMNFQKGTVVKKNKTNVTLAAGLDFYGSVFIAYYLKTTGLFDYSFTNVAPDHKTFNVVYVNYDKESEGKDKRIIGSFAYNKEKEIVEDKMSLVDKPTSYIALPAKAGYVTIFEYYKKTKSINIRLEKLNF